MPKDSTFKENRADRQDKRIQKLKDKRIAEAKQAGYGPIDVNPVTADYKSTVDEEVKKGLEGQILADIEKIQSVTPLPEVEVPDAPKQDYTIQDVRRQRRAKIGDVLTAFNQGYYGRPVTNQFQERLKGENLARYEQYKNLSEAAKKTSEDWKTNYINKQLDYINKKLTDPNTSDMQRKQLLIQDEKLRLAKAQADKAEKQAELVGKEEPKGEEMASVRQPLGGGASTSYKIPVSEAQKLSKEAYAKERQDKLNEASSHREKELQEAQKIVANMDETNQGTSWYEKWDKEKRKKYEDIIIEINDERKGLMDEVMNQYPLEQEQSKDQGTSSGNILENIVNDL